MEATLKLETRDTAGKGVARKLRQNGRVPGIVYGAGEEPLMVSMEAHGAVRLFQEISADNTILDLVIDGKKGVRALAREIQVHPYKTQLIHVDFVRIQVGVAIEVHVPVHLIGTPEGVRTEGGLLEQPIHDVVVRCIPRLIPGDLSVDVTHLTIGDVLRAGEIDLPEGVELITDEKRTVCIVSAPRVVEEAEDEEEDVEDGEATEATDATDSTD